MPDVLKRHKYAVNRVLIPAARILSPEFEGAYLFLSGAHIELLRNLVDYANRETTFVSSYGEGYYYTPTDENWDTITAIVADLEEVLMGGQNVVWGYSDPLYEEVEELDVAAGTVLVNATAIGADKAGVLQSIDAFNQTTSISSIRLRVQYGGFNLTLLLDSSPAANIATLWRGSLALPEGARVQGVFSGCVEGDNLYLRIGGYQMNV